MAFRSFLPLLALFAAVPFTATPARLRAQVFVVGEKTATADVSTEFHATKVELPTKPLDELGRRELIRDLEAEQGFAHRPLPLANTITLVANGNMTPNGDAYRQLIYKKGQSAAAGDRVAVTAVTIKGDRILIDLNGGPYLKHRFLRHVELNDAPVVANNLGEEVSGLRIALVFEGGIPEVSAPEVKALLDPLIDFGVKSSGEAYASTLPSFLKTAVDHHDILVGMNRRMVLASAGAPESKLRELVPGSETQHYEEWIYGKVPETVRFVRIENDRVTQVRIAALGQPIVTKTENELQGYLDPLDTREVAMGDARGSQDEDARPAGAPPTLRQPGDPDPPNAAQRVQYPVEKTKAEPLPAAPGSPADTTTNSVPPIASGPNGRNPGATGIDPATNPAAGPIGQGTGGAVGPGSRVH